MKRILIVSGGAAALVAGIVFAALFIHARNQRDKIEAFLPQLAAETSIDQAELAARLSATAARLRNGLFPLPALQELSRLYHANGDYEGAIACYESLRILEPNEPRWPHLLSKIKASYGLLDEAIEASRVTVALAPDYVPAHLDLGNALFKRNDLAEAEDALASALEIDSDNPYALVGLARIRIDNNDWATAEGLLERAVERSNSHVGVELLATAYRELGQSAKADRLLFEHDIGTHTDPADPWQEELLTDCYDSYALSLASGMAAKRGDAEAAKKWIDRAASLAPNDPIILFQLGHTAMAAGDATDAINYYQRSVRAKPDFSDGWHYLVLAYRNVGDIRSAAQALAKGFENCPDSPSLLIEVANLLVEQGKYPRSIDLLQKSIRLRSNEAYGYVALARVYFKIDKVELGIQAMEDALSAEPRNPTALTTLAFYQINSGNEEKALEYLAKIKSQPKIDPREVGRLETEFRKRFSDRLDGQ